jgi:hypothetical protein
MSVNLNIQTYTFDELLDLFHLSQNFTKEHLKQAKKQVLLTHPDKSNLPPEYFIFFKKAFEIVVHHFEEQNKQNVIVPDTQIDYTPLNIPNYDPQIQKIIKTNSSTQLNKKFNEIFEKTMATRPDQSQNEWFKTENTEMDYAIFQKIKTNGLVHYKGVDMYQPQMGMNLYDADTSSSYASSDIFGKLKYDDIRKVHKDQTVFAVSENDFEKVKTYNSVEEYKQTRNSNIEIMTKTEAEQLLEKQKKEKEQEIIKKQFDANLKTMEYEEKNKSILSYFLRLT